MARGEIERRGGEGQQVVGPRGQRAFLHVESNHHRQRRQTFFLLQDQGDHTRRSNVPAWVHIYLFGRVHSRGINARVIQRWTHFTSQSTIYDQLKQFVAPSELRDCLG